MSRYGHSAVVWKNFIIIFGGYSSFVRNDIYAFDCKKEFWEKYEFGTKFQPPRMSYHTAVVYNDSMFIYGGNLESYSYILSNQLYKYSCTKKLKVIHQKFLIILHVFSKIKCTFLEEH